MADRTGSGSVSRRSFLATTGGVLAAAPVVRSASSKPREAPGVLADAPAAGKTMRKIPIGVFDPVYDHLSLDEMLEKISALGIEAVEMGTGGFPGTKHCPVAELLADSSKAKAWKRKFEERNILVATLSCHGNPIHPNPEMAKKDDESFRRTVRLAEMLEVPTIVTFSGCPGDGPGAKHPNWVTYRWPPDYEEVVTWQWKEVVIPYWREAVKFARQHGVKRIALEMHPGFVVYNPLYAARTAPGRGRGNRRELRPQPPLLARLRPGRGHPLPRKTKRHLPRAHEGHGHLQGYGC